MLQFALKNKLHHDHKIIILFLPIIEINLFTILKYLKILFRFSRANYFYYEYNIRKFVYGLIRNSE